MFSQAGRSRQLVLVVTILTIYSTDKWNPINIIILIKHTITKRITINKFYKIFKTQTTQQVDNNNVIKIA